MQVTLPSPAERLILGALVGCACAGGLLGYVALGGLQGMVEIVGPEIGGMMSVGASFFGGLGSAILVRDRLGREGTRGVLSAIAGGVLATALLGIIAGTIVLPIFGTMFGPWLVLMTAATKPWYVLPWIASLYGMHKARRSYLAEQETLFRYVPRIDAT